MKKNTSRLPLKKSKKSKKDSSNDLLLDLDLPIDLVQEDEINAEALLKIEEIETVIKDVVEETPKKLNRRIKYTTSIAVNLKMKLEIIIIQI